MLDLSLLRRERKAKGLSLAQAGRRLGLSAPQVYRIEKGERRMTLDLLARYAVALELDLATILFGEIRVPVVGVIDESSRILSLPPNSPCDVLAPHIVPDIENLAAVRWSGTGRLGLMADHHMFFRRNVVGISPDVWGQRSVIRFRNGQQRLGWLIRDGGQVHVDDTIVGGAEFNVQVEWASRVLAVIPPKP